MIKPENYNKYCFLVEMYFTPAIRCWKNLKMAPESACRTGNWPSPTVVVFWWLTETQSLNLDHRQRFRNLPEGSHSNEETLIGLFIKFKKINQIFSSSVCWKVAGASFVKIPLFVHFVRLYSPNECWSSTNAAGCISFSDNCNSLDNTRHQVSTMTKL